MRNILSIFLVFAFLSGCADEKDETEVVESVTSDPGTYQVTVNGAPVSVKRVERFQTPVQYVRFDYTAASDVVVNLGTAIPATRLSPERLGIQTTLKGTSISFSVTQPNYLVLSPDGMERLFILVDPPETAPPAPNGAQVTNVGDIPGIDKTGSRLVTGKIQNAIDAASGAQKNVVYVPAGTYLVGELWMRDNMTLYLADGAVLKASRNLADIVTANTDGSVIEQCLHAIIRMNGVTNSHLKGRGTIDAGGVYLRDEDIPETKYNLLKIEDSVNCTVDGIIAIDSSFWNTIVYRSDQIQITNFKVINNRLSFGWNETDGVDFDNATNSILSNAFLYAGDDCMATKSDDIADDYIYPAGVENYPADPTTGAYVSVDNVIHENVICLTNQSACKIGTKTMGTDMGNVHFKNIDVLKCGRGLVIDSMDTARVHDIFFQDIHFEFVKPYSPVVFNIRGGTDWRYSEGVGQVTDIFAENIYLNGMDGSAGITIEGRRGADADYPIGSVNFTNLQVDGTPVNASNQDSLIRLSATLADDITFE